MLMQIKEIYLVLNICTLFKYTYIFKEYSNNVQLGSV